MGNRKKRDTVQDLLAIAFDDEQLPEGATKRCIERVAVETGPFRVIPRPAHLRKRKPNAERVAAPVRDDESGDGSGATSRETTGQATDDS